MAELRRSAPFVVELTPEGVQEIQSHKNIYTEDTKPIPCPAASGPPRTT